MRFSQFKRQSFLYSKQHLKQILCNSVHFLSASQRADHVCMYVCMYVCMCVLVLRFCIIFCIIVTREKQKCGSYLMLILQVYLVLLVCSCTIQAFLSSTYAFSVSVNIFTSICEKYLFKLDKIRAMSHMDPFKLMKLSPVQVYQEVDRQKRGRVLTFCQFI